MVGNGGSLRGVSGGAELHLVGGFGDQHGTSGVTLGNILHFYHSCAAPLELKLAYVAHLNTRPLIGC